MMTFLKKAHLGLDFGIALEAVAAFAVAGGLLEWLHPGLVSDVLPWAVVAALAAVLTIGLASQTRQTPASVRWLAVVAAVIVAIVATFVAFGYFAPIPRFQPWLSLAAGATVVLGAGLFIYHQPKP